MLSDSFYKCKSCGQDFPVYLDACPNCGAVYLSERNPFISFWLWFCIVINFFTIVFELIVIFYSYSKPGVWSDVVAASASLLALFGFVMLLKKKKAGFYLCLLVTFVNIITTLMSTGFGFILFIQPIGIVALYFILKIRREGVPYWDRLE